MPQRLQVRTPADYRIFASEDVQQGIHQRIECIAKLHPENIAIKEGDIALSYRTMNGFANAIADAILSSIGKDLAQAVILLPVSHRTVLAMLGAMKARKAYVPMDVHFPADRLRTMVKDACPAVVLTDTQHLRMAEDLTEGRTKVIDVSGLRLDADAPNIGSMGNPLDRAYILYTSGSTGKPKGIEFLHRNLLHTTMCLTNRLFFSASDRVTWLHSPTFGSSVVDIYCCLTNGGTLLPWDIKTQGFNGMSDWLNREKATTFQWIPSAFRQFVRTLPSDCVFEDVRIVVMAGESLTVREAEMFKQHFPRGAHLVNQVGTGESYNYCLYCVDHELTIEGAGVPGGYPVSDDREVLILDEERRCLPREEVGEIAIRSDYMAAGYWNDEKQTAEKFVRIGGQDRPVYLTGDVGKIDADGCLLHLGRKDFQIKLRGCRVEVAEVEHFLARTSGVTDAAVWIAKSRAGEDQLVAYVVMAAGMQLDEAGIISSLAGHLPDYMVPRHYVRMEALPTLPTGKVNRRGLPNPFDHGARQTQHGSEPQNEIENEIVSFFSDILQTGDVTGETHFVKSGGDSLMGAVLIERIFRRFGVKIGFAQLAEAATPQTLARIVAGLRATRTPVQKPANLPGVRQPGKLSDKDETIRLTLSEPSGEDPRGEGRSSSRRARIKDLVIIGAGQCGREIYTWAEQSIAAGAPWRIKGFLDTRTAVLDGYAYDHEVIGAPIDYEIAENDVFVGALGDPRDKIKFYSPIAKKGGRFINIIHPLANIGKNVRMGNGIVLAPFSSVTSDVRIGSHVSIGAFSNIAHDVTLGDWCQISSHCGINGGAALAEGVFAGSHACVVPGITVGSWAYLGAGSVVVRDTPKAAKIFGNPAAVIGQVERGNSEE